MKEDSRAQSIDSIPARIAEDRAAKILERAAVLDAKRNSEIEIDQLREAAADAGISREAFEEALREQSTELQLSDGKRGVVKAGRKGAALASADVAHYAALLRDVLGDEGQVTVADVIEWKDEDGLSVSVNPTKNSVTSSVSVEGRLRSKLMGVVLPALLPAAFFFMVAVAGEEEALFGFFAALLAALGSMGGTVFVHKREQKALRKKAERIRRQLQHLLTPTE